ncbi:MAG TPA: serine protease [Gammaproteobacteria bacterium]|jgi:serine protease Do|nr:serine protease [Gammaproteobacteria bacterium]
MEKLFRKFAPLCAMVMKPNGESVEFLGTAFAVHKDGYLVTAAHVVKGQEQIVISPTTNVTGYQTTSNKLRALAASVVQLDEANDLALLELKQPMQLQLPANLLGDADAISPGTKIMHLGYPFGTSGSLILVMRSGHLTAKVEATQGIKQLYVEGIAYSGAAGGPLVDATKGNIIGIVNSQIGLVPKPTGADNDYKLPVLTELTFATPINVVTALLNGRQPS